MLYQSLSVQQQFSLLCMNLVLVSLWDVVYPTLTLDKRKNKVFYFATSAASAGLGEFVSLLVRNPLEVLKQNLQMPAHEGMTKMVKDIWRVRGLRGFYTGLVPSVFREIPFSLTQLPVFELFQKVLQPYELYFKQKKA